MAFTLNPEKTFSEAVHRVAVSELEDAIAILKKQPHGLHEAIHDARKKFKRVRGLYRLARPAAKKFSKAQNALVRDMAASLSAGRDATALIECAGYLRTGVNTGQTDMALARLETALVERRNREALGERELQQLAQRAVKTCHEALDALKHQKFPGNRAEAANHIEKSWKKELANAQVAMMSAQAEGESADFHELRKKAQTYWMFCALVSRIWPSAMKAKQKNAKALADLLGHEHDLSVLLELLDGEGLPDLDAITLETCRKEVIAVRKALRKRTIKAARKVFDDEADSEAAVVAELWRWVATA